MVRVMNLAHWLLKQHDSELMLAVIVICAGCSARLPRVLPNQVDNVFQKGVRTAIQARTASPTKGKRADFDVDIPLSEITRDHDASREHNIKPHALPELTYVELLHLALQLRDKCKELLSDASLAIVPHEAMPAELWQTITNLLGDHYQKQREPARKAAVLRRLLAEHARGAFSSLPIACGLAFWDAVCFASRRVANLSKTEYSEEAESLPLVPIVHAMGLGDLLDDRHALLALGEASERCFPTVFFRSLEIVCRDFADPPPPLPEPVPKEESVQVEPTEEQPQPAANTEDQAETTEVAADQGETETETKEIKSALKSGAAETKEKKAVSIDES